MPRPSQPDTAVTAIMRALIREGREKGSLTYDDIIAAFEDHELAPDQLERFLTDLAERGIEVIETDGSQPESEAANVDLTIDPSLDSLRMYLREIGRVPLLTAGQEVSLAKRIDTVGRIEDTPTWIVTTLPKTRWLIPRETRSDERHAATVIRTLEDAPFYARSMVSSRLNGAPVVMMHESLSLERFRRPLVKLMLPFRMPRVGR